MAQIIVRNLRIYWILEQTIASYGLGYIFAIFEVEGAWAAGLSIPNLDSGYVGRSW